MDGTVTLRGREQPVHITYDTFSRDEQIAVGNESYQLQGHGADHFDGHRLVSENGRPVVDKNIQITTNPSFLEQVRQHPKEAAQEIGLSNAEEVACPPEANAFIIVGDNLTMELVGNSAHLQ